MIPGCEKPLYPDTTDPMLCGQECGQCGDEIYCGECLDAKKGIHADEITSAVEGERMRIVSALYAWAVNAKGLASMSPSDVINVVAGRLRDGAL